MRRVRHLLLDLGGVLYGVEYHRTAIALGLSPHALPELLNDPILAQYEEGAISTEEFLRHWQARFPHLSPPQLVEAWNKMLLGPLPQVETILSELCSHFSLALLSNTNDLHLAIVEPEISAWRPFFEGIFFSNRIHKRKPNPETYLYVLEVLGWAGKETLFIDDSLLNVQGAQRAGLHGYHFSPPNQPERLLQIAEAVLLSPL
ncbi:MAG: HAD family phosphatase [Bacteroidia bacterium]|nr:HAD family phosphatase [Bacteroidia bacterium]MCX7764076.1 HAD family phosphatase [Bacteroidia bacterium]MDW8057874.1 HAD family phosphatase [Bacteroidia bacterium]